MSETPREPKETGTGAPNPEEARRARLRKRFGGGSASSSAKAAERTSPYPRIDGDRSPLSSSQLRAWFLDEVEGSSAARTFWGAYRIKGPLQVGALRSAFGLVMDRHDALRSFVNVVDGVPFSIDSGVRTPDWIVDCPQAPQPGMDREDALKGFLHSFLSGEISLSKAPLIRCGLFQVKEQEHVLALEIHHGIVDGQSLDILLRDLGSAYGAEITGDSAWEGPPPVRFGDYAAWQREFVESDAVKKQIPYWLDHLKKPLPYLDLPTDRPRTPNQEFQGAGAHAGLGLDICHAATSLARSEGATPFMVFLTAFFSLLHRYSGQNDIVVGTPIAGRNHPGVNETVGFFANTLALRTRFHSGMSFRDALRQVRESCFGAYENQDLPFDTLVQALQPDRDLSRTPVYQAMLGYEERAGKPALFPGLAVEWEPLNKTIAQTDLSWWMERSDEGLTISADFPKALFDEETGVRMLASYESLLRAGCLDADLRVDELPLTDGASSPELALGTGRTEPIEADTELVDWLMGQWHEWAEGMAVAGAVAGAERSLSYAQLQSQVDALAHHLVICGVEPGGLVGIYLPRSPSLVVATLAVWKVGAAYVPLDPDHPTARLVHVVNEAGIQLLISQTDHSDPASALSEKLVFLDRLDTGPAQSGPGFPTRRNPEGLAYVTFTSGSTGKPKGVEVQQSGVQNFLRSMASQPGFASSDRLLAVTTLSFDISVLELFLPLSVGGQCVVADEAAVGDGRELSRLLDAHDITVMQATPATWRILFESGWQGRPDLRVLVGGEALPPILAKELVGGCREVWNMYGPTETTVWSTLARVDGEGTPISIGGPIHNTQVHVLDPRGRPLPVGVVGELYIGGAGVARGYRNQPELTAERFLPDPFSQATGARMYRTGDLARFRNSGELEYLGRLDNQVKIRGFRIELGEIEAVLAQHPDVRQTVVQVYGKDADARLVAFAAFHGGATLTSADAREFLKPHLPAYMIPGVLVGLPEIPLTPNGKVDRKALPEPDLKARKPQETSREPESPTEIQLAEIWGEVLGYEKVGAEDDFFALGGHSLLATQIFSRIAQLGVDLPLRTLFEAPTVAGLAEALDAAATGGKTAWSDAGMEPIGKASIQDRMPLSFAQERLWFLDGITEPSSLYNVVLNLEVRGPLDIRALRASLDALVERHEALRTTIRQEGGTPFQSIAPNDHPLPWEWKEEDLSALRDPAQALDRIHEESQRPFDLAQGPLFRACLFRKEAEAHVLQFTIHHAVSDGWSMRVLVRDLGLSYASHIGGNQGSLPELPIQYSDYSVWQRNFLEDQAFHGQMDYWRERLAGLKPLALPTDRPRPALMGLQGKRRPAGIPAGLGPKLRELARDEGATLFMALLAAFQLLLHRYSQQEDIAVGTPIAGRNRKEVEDLIGLFVNTLVMRTEVSGESSFREILAQVRKRALEAYAHQDLPFERLVEELQPERDLGRNPLFQIMFAFESASENDLAIPGLGVRSFPAEDQTAKFDLSLALWESPEADQEGEIEGSWEFATGLFDPETVDQMQKHFQHLLHAIVENPETPVGRLPLLSPSDRTALLDGLNPTQRDSTQPFDTLHEIVAAQAAVTPDGVALVAGQESLSYADLEARANRLAHHLRGLGLSQGGLAGVFLPRTSHLAVSVLAVLKAGGGYLPLDPDFPAERITHMLDDSGARVIVTTGELLDLLPPFSGSVVCLDQAEAEIQSLPSTPPHSTPESDPVAYVIYTSGSTGRPKGVEVYHQNAINFLTSMAREPGFASDDRLLAVTTLSFDISVLEIFLPLVVGGTVVIADADSARDGHDLQSLMKEHGITVMQATPATWRMLFDDGWAGDPGLRVLVGGEALPPDLAQELVRSCGEVWNMYGPTETTVWSTVARVLGDGSPISIGRPIDNTRIYILDSRQEPVPLGVSGELYIGGAGVARGYRNLPELTAQRFLLDPFSEAPRARMYRTGDLARFRRGGELEYLGRLDNQVKIRGFRIELGEVEAALGKHDSINQVVVHAHGEGTDVRLVAYAVFEPGDNLTATETRRFLRSRLPTYMIPGLLVELDALPLTPNGKVDRKALPNPFQGGRAPDRKHLPPQTQEEIVMAGVWSELLNTEPIGRTDNFYDLGGHSLLSMKAVSILEGHFGIRLNPRSMFFKNLEQLAADLCRNEGIES